MLARLSVFHGSFDPLAAVEVAEVPAGVLESLRRKSLLQQRANTLLRDQEMAAAVPVLLQLAEVSAQLGHSERRASALYNAAIGLASGGQYEAAGGLAALAAELYDPDSNDAASARRLVAYCHEKQRLT